MNTLKKILYVEDEPDIRAVAEVALVHLGGLVLKMCASGEEALREAEAFAPDMVLLDVMMPGLDGPSTLKALRALPSMRQVPVAFMTAKVQPNEVAQYIALGAVDVIAKPFDPMTLAEKVRASWVLCHG